MGKKASEIVASMARDIERYRAAHGGRSPEKIFMSRSLLTFLRTNCPAAFGRKNPEFDGVPIQDFKTTANRLEYVLPEACVTFTMN